MAYHSLTGEQMRTFKLEIKQDESPESPREFDNLGKMVLFHRDGYGDKHNFTVDEAKAVYTRMQKGEGVALPIFMYQHSGVTISTKPFSCPWDSAQVGFIYADKEAIRNNWNIKAVSKKRLAQALSILQSEVETYDQFLTGDVYGYIIKDEDNEVVDSCWGFYGLEDAKAQGKEALESQIAWEAKPLKAWSRLCF